ncbi:MAG TPA: VWA domain-containing protein [Phycisphaerales bacterium]|nr:VWA domain-containing protein [Phycisphaerales bacterium]
MTAAADQLTLTAAFDRDNIDVRGTSVRYLVVDATAPTLPTVRSEKPPLNLSLVIDASGSMTGPPLEAAKQAAASVAEALSESDALSIISFDTESIVHLPPTRQDSAAKARTARAIAALQPRESTNLSDGWLKGCEQVATEMQARAGLRNRVVLFSDGHANHGIMDPAQLATHAAELYRRGIITSCVGIGAGYSEVQIASIAEHGGGNLHHADTPGQIANVVLGELDQLRETAVESCDFVLELPEGVRVEVMGDYACRTEASRLVCTLGPLVSGAQRAAIFKVTCSDGSLGSTIHFDVRARWTRPGATSPNTTRASRSSLRYVDRCHLADRDLRLASRVAQTWQAWAVRSAMRLNQDGALKAAYDFVERELRYLRRYCEALPEGNQLVIQLERLQPMLNAHFDRLTAKEISSSVGRFMRARRDHRPSSKSSWSDHLNP